MTSQSQQQRGTSTATAPRGGGRVVRVELALYVLLALLAFVLRLADLDARLMVPSEAGRALGALQLANGLEPSAAQSPLLLHGTALAFLILRADDAIARLLPTLFGVALVLAPALFRRELSRGGALAASVLLALSPVGLFYSRYLGPEITVAAAGVALAGAGARYSSSGSAQWFVLAGGALAVLLASGPGAWTLVLLAALLVAATAALGSFGRRGGAWEAAASVVTHVQRHPVQLRAAGLTFVTVLVGIGTAALFHLSGLAGVGQQLTLWLRGFRAGMGELPWYGSLVILLVYEPLVAVFGIAGIVRAVRGGELWRGLLAYWVLGALVFLLVWPGRTAGDLLLASFPLTLLAAERIAALAAELRERTARWRGLAVAGIALVLLGYLYLQLAAYADSGQSGYLTLTLVTAGLLVLLAAGAGGLVGVPVMRRGAAVAALASLGLVMVASARGAAFDYREGRTELLGGAPTDEGVRRMVQTLDRISLQRVGGEMEMPITVVGDSPLVLQWYLRRHTQLTITPGSSSPYDTSAVITDSEIKPALAGDYTGQSFALRTFDDVWGLSGRRAVRWLLFRARPAEPPPTESLVLWIKLETAPQ